LWTPNLASCFDEMQGFGEVAVIFYQKKSKRNEKNAGIPTDFLVWLTEFCHECTNLIEKGK